MSLEKYYPGRRVELDNGVVATVYPIGIRHIEKYVAAVARAASQLAEVRVRVDPKTRRPLPEDIDRVAPVIADVALKDLRALIDETVKLEPVLDLWSLAHWHAMQVVEVWVHENFLAEGRLDPWMRVGKEVMTRLSNSTTSSSSSSPAAGSMKTSFTPDSQDSRTADGPSGNGGTGHEALQSLSEQDERSTLPTSTEPSWERSTVRVTQR